MAHEVYGVSASQKEYSNQQSCTVLIHTQWCVILCGVVHSVYMTSIVEEDCDSRSLFWETPFRCVRLTEGVTEFGGRREELYG